MQDMLGKVPNKANTLWKVIMRVSVVLLVFALLISLWAYSKLVRGGWAWSVPQELVDSLDFDKLTGSFEDMIADGFVDRSIESELPFDERSSFFVGYADRSQFATPFVQVLWSRNGANLQSEAICLAKTELQINLEDFDFADGNHFYQEVYIKKGSCIMEISWYTPTCSAAGSWSQITSATSATGIARIDCGTHDLNTDSRPRFICGKLASICRTFW